MATASQNPIYDATLCRCLEEQYHAAECFHRASTWLEYRGGTDPHALLAAIREQMIGAYHSEQVRIRLDRINGHA